MPSLLQARLSCFYCGARSRYPKDGRTRQFLCPNCTAVNHLDPNGDITDPPTTPTADTNASFAHPPSRPTSPILPPADALFCKACLKNQQLLTDMLAEYLPPEDDPRYARYEAEYPDYRKKLELRYPQVCLQCAPRVQKHLNKTVYQAKVDFLARNIERSNARSASHLSTTASLSILGLNLVSIAWCIGLVLQATWHAFAFMGVVGGPGQVAGTTASMFIGCSLHGARSGFLPQGCANLFDGLVKKSLVLGLLLLWWNPTLKDRARYPDRATRPSGLLDFYRLQALVLAARAAAWCYLRTPWLDGAASDVVKGTHGFALLLVLLSTAASFRLINYSTAPKVSFKTSTQPLVEPGSFQYPADRFSSKPSSQPPTTSSPARQPFPLTNLGTRQSPQLDSPPQSRFAPHAGPVSSSAYDGVDDSMDWEPVQSSPINPPPTVQPSPAASLPAFLRPAPSMATGAKSPFTGRLPPAPISPAHRLRNPPAPPQFKPTPLSQQQDFFKKMGLSSAKVPVLSKRPAAQQAPASPDPSSQSYVSSLSRDSFDLRPAQWTLKSDMDAATKGTGLEDMFTTSFKIADEPPPLRAGESAGDERDIFHPRAQAAVQTTKDIVHKNLRDAGLPIGLALVALVVAVLRDPGAREWLGGMWTGLTAARTE